MSPRVNCWSLKDNSTQSRAASRTLTRRNATDWRAVRANASATRRSSETRTPPGSLAEERRGGAGGEELSVVAAVAVPKLSAFRAPSTTARSTSGLSRTSSIDGSAAERSRSATVMARNSTKSSGPRFNSSATSAPSNSSSGE